MRPPGSRCMNILLSPEVFCRTDATSNFGVGSPGAVVCAATLSVRRRSHGSDEERDRPRCGRARVVGHLNVKNSAHAIQKRTACRRGSKAQLAASPRLELCERRRITDRIPAHRHSHIVAAMLALIANARRQPPDRRVIEQQRLSERLHQVDEVVVTSHMGDLMREDRFDLRGIELRHGRNRKHHDRPQAPDHQRHIDVRKLDDANDAKRVQVWTRCDCPLPASWNTSTPARADADDERATSRRPRGRAARSRRITRLKQSTAAASRHAVRSTPSRVKGASFI